MVVSEVWCGRLAVLTRPRKVRSFLLRFLIKLKMSNSTMYRILHWRLPQSLNKRRNKVEIKKNLLWSITQRQKLFGRSRDRIPVGARFSAPVLTGPGAHPASYTMGTRSFPGVKRPGRGLDHQTPSSAEVEERVELYLYCPSGLSWPVIGWPLPLFCRSPIPTCWMSTEKLFVDR